MRRHKIIYFFFFQKEKKIISLRFFFKFAWIKRNLRKVRRKFCFNKNSLTTYIFLYIFGFISAWCHYIFSGIFKIFFLIEMEIDIEILKAYLSCRIVRILKMKINAFVWWRRHIFWAFLWCREELFLWNKIRLKLKLVSFTYVIPLFFFLLSCF
jgi:hypothetical protein